MYKIKKCECIFSETKPHLQDFLINLTQLFWAQKGFALRVECISQNSRCILIHFDPKVLIKP